ncbi:MAG: hypothetical protein ACREBD_19285 [Blastocatellia bacterium]
MQQPCPRCGYVSDRPARFCRQCGARLVVENEATSATTREYPPHQATNPYDAEPYRSQFAQSGRAGAETPETSRFYHPPMTPNYPNYTANYPAPETKKSGAWKWVLIALFCFLLVGGGISAMVISAIRAKQAAENFAPDTEEIAARVREEIEREMERAREDAQRAVEDMKRAAEDARRAAEEGAAPPAPPPPPAPPAPGEAPASLQQYKYPGAEMTQSASVVGNEFVKMLTEDSVSEVREYYQRRLGNPVIKGDEESVVFQIPGSPTTIIAITPDEDNAGKTQITVFRSRFQVPRLN